MKKSMPTAVTALLKQKREEAERLRSEHVGALVEGICDRYGLSHVELSLALGCYAPARGKRGASAANSWCRRAERCSDENMILLEIITSGRINLVITGRDGRRFLYTLRVEG